MQITIYPITAWEKGLTSDDKAKQVEAVIVLSYPNMPKDRLSDQFSKQLILDGVKYDPKGHTYLSSFQANQIRMFVESLEPSIPLTITAHSVKLCTAIKAAILRASGQDDRYLWRSLWLLPDTTVYVAVCLAFDIQVTDDDLAERDRITKRSQERHDRWRERKRKQNECLRHQRKRREEGYDD